MTSLDQLCAGARDVIRTAVEFIRSQAQTFRYDAVEHKGFNDLVSYVDLRSEQVLVEGLGKLLPGSGFITEEKTAVDSGERFRWVIDPLDGTTNFVHGVPCYCVSVALLDGDHAVMGIVHEVNLDECFYSWEGAPAFMNDREVRVSERTTLRDSLVATGFPYTDFTQAGPYMKVFEYLMRHTHGIRRPGSAAADLAYLACGRFDAFYEYGLHAWDVAAGSFLVRQAGGRISDFSGGDGFLFGKEIIASNNHVYAEFASVVQRHMHPTP